MGLGDRDRAQRVPDEHEPLESGVIGRVDDGLHGIVECHRGDLGLAAAATGQVNGDGRRDQMHQHRIPTCRGLIRDGIEYWLWQGHSTRLRAT
jgi:hypothetical protein